MAYTKIFPIRTRLDRRVRYALNGKKTALETAAGYAPVSYTHLDVYKRQFCNKEPCSAFEKKRQSSGDSAGPSPLGKFSK